MRAALILLAFLISASSAMAAPAEYALVLTAPKDEMVAVSVDDDGNATYAKVTHPINYVTSTAVWDAEAQPDWRPPAGTRAVPKGSLNIGDTVPQ